MTMAEDQIKKQVEALNLTITNVTPYSDIEDAAIELGGEYDGIHISIGYGYYSVVKETPRGSFIFIHGKGNLKKELKEALNAE